tara:strand:+ start:589 stop:846 length:258 start_codon:yes stop_codon:yes gene_type:complete
MRKILLTIFYSGFIFIGSIHSYSVEDEDKSKLLSELCAMDDGNWSSKRLNEMIILLKFGKLTPEKSLEGNRILAGLTCDFYNKKI